MANGNYYREIQTAECHSSWNTHWQRGSPLAVGHQIQHGVLYGLIMSTMVQPYVVLLQQITHNHTSQTSMSLIYMLAIQLNSGSPVQTCESLSQSAVKFPPLGMSYFTVGSQLLHNEVAMAFCNHFMLISHLLLISVHLDDLSHVTTLKCYHSHKKSQTMDIDTAQPDI